MLNWMTRMSRRRATSVGWELATNTLAPPSSSVNDAILGGMRTASPTHPPQHKLRPPRFEPAPHACRPLRKVPSPCNYVECSGSLHGRENDTSDRSEGARTPLKNSAPPHHQDDITSSYVNT